MYPGQTYNGERARLCSRCHDMLTMPECEMLAAVNRYKNERLAATPLRSSSNQHPSKTLSVARASTPGPANPEFYAPPRSLFSRRLRCKTRVLNVDIPRRARVPSTGSDDSAPSTSSEVSPPTSEDEPSLQEDSDGADTADNNGDSNMENSLTEAAMQENWTFDECRSRPDLFRYLEITQHVRFGDGETSMVTSKAIEVYDREKDDSLPWATAHDVEASERARSALCAEIIASGTANNPPPAACSAAASADEDATGANDEDATDASDEDDTAATGGFLGGLPRLSRRSTMFGMAAVAVGLVAWGASRRR